MWCVVGTRELLPPVSEQHQQFKAMWEILRIQTLGPNSNTYQVPSSNDYLAVSVNFPMVLTEKRHKKQRLNVPIAGNT